MLTSVAQRRAGTSRNVCGQRVEDQQLGVNAVVKETVIDEGCDVGGQTK